MTPWLWLAGILGAALTIIAVAACVCESALRHDLEEHEHDR